MSEQFFEQMLADGDIEVSFGTQGMIRESLPSHFQRFSMENTSAPAERIIARDFARGAYKRITGRAFAWWAWN